LTQNFEHSRIKIIKLIPSFEIKKDFDLDIINNFFNIIPSHTIDIARIEALKLYKNSKISQQELSELTKYDNIIKSAQFHNIVMYGNLKKGDIFNDFIYTLTEKYIYGNKTLVITNIEPKICNRI